MFKEIGFVWGWVIAKLKVSIKSELTDKQLLWLILAVLIAVLPQMGRLPVWFLPMTFLVVGYRVYTQVNHIKKGLIY